MTLRDDALKLHLENHGKLAVVSKVPIKTREDLALAYTPGVAEPCKEIKENKDLSFEYTCRGNMVAIVSDGTRVLGLGDIGPEAAMPVMEGKAALFKTFGDVDAVPICIDTKDPAKIIETVRFLQPSFAGINLEDISSPKCYDIECELKKICDIPVFHDDQHGTAIVVGAALMNACKVANKKIEDITLVINGAGAAGCAIGKLLLSLGIGNLIMVDREGIICEGDNYLNEAHAEMAKVTNKNKLHGSLADALKGADAFVGVSKPKLVTAEMVKSMNDKPILFAMANPTPEIMPDEAKAAGAFIVGTGRSDFPNQINNVIAFPGIFKGALAVRASDINEEMKMAAAKAIAGCVPEDKLNAEFILPNSFDRSVPIAVAEAVAKAARETGVARI